MTISRWMSPVTRASWSPMNILISERTPKCGQIDAGLHGEAAPRHHAPLVVSFEIVHVGAVAVDFDADRVSGAVREELGVARL